MSKGIYITGTGPRSGKSVVVLGVMELLAQHGRKIGFFRPVVDEDAISDHLVALVMSRYDITAPRESMFGATDASLRDLISRDKEDELHSRILEKYRALEHECDFVVCAGTDYKTMHTALEFEFNVEVARNLGTPLMPVVAGQGRKIEEMVDAVHVLAQTLEAKKCDVLSIIVNRVAPDDVTDAVARFQEASPAGVPVSVLPVHPLLDKPTVAEIKRALGAEMLHGDVQWLDREVGHYKVAAMELAHFLDHLEEGSLVITPGDRSIFVIGISLLMQPPPIAIGGIILTGGFRPVPQVLRLLEGLKRSPVPILCVTTDTFTTATMVTSLHAVIAPENQRKIAGALGVLDSNIDLGRLERRIAVMRSSRVTPIMFQYDLLSRTRSKRRHIVPPEGTEERILRAAEIMRLRDVVEVTCWETSMRYRRRSLVLSAFYEPENKRG